MKSVAYSLDDYIADKTLFLGHEVFGWSLDLILELGGNMVCELSENFSRVCECAGVFFLRGEGLWFSANSQEYLWHPKFKKYAPPELSDMDAVSYVWLQKLNSHEIQ